MYRYIPTNVGNGRKSIKYLHIFRYLIEATTGVFTGSMYNDIYLKKEGENNRKRKLAPILYFASQ